jgi:hypothetical protein
VKIGRLEVSELTIGGVPVRAADLHRPPSD